MTTASRIADQGQRDAAIAERRRNVLIDAGAGTGKTTILVRRLVNMVAPEDGSPGIPIERIVAITFTRKAAGELRLRVREHLLRNLAREPPNSQRAGYLRAAFAGVDGAHIGTIHSTADRLLRLCPVEAGLSPSYDIVEDDEPLIEETFSRLLHAVETGTLGSELAGTKAGPYAAEAGRVVVDSLHAGLRANSRELDYWTQHGLSGLVAEFIRHRDAPPAFPDAIPSFDYETFRSAVRQLTQLLDPLTASSRGFRRLRDLQKVASDLAESAEPVAILRELSPALSSITDLQKKRDFDGDKDTWRAFQQLRDGPPGQVPLATQLIAPARQWLGRRLVTLFPVVTTLYEQVKAKRKVVDHVDLLIKLRDVLLTDKRARRSFQMLFDHVFVDEFQDTDPLQAEIILFLCEADPTADEWRRVRVADGKLTIVGDPKQSIYRFRRADIEMYDDVRQLIGQRDHLNARLSVNFRSTSALIAWFDGCFKGLLGAANGQMLFNRSTGEVYHQPLLAHRKDTAPHHVHILPFEVASDDRAESYRRVEAKALASYLRWLVEERRFDIVDPLTEQMRTVGYGDIAVLAIATPALLPLFAELDASSVPYVARGGRLFLQDPMHRQFLLGLRAIADPADGVARAALMRPPFFAIDLNDHARSRSASPEISPQLREAQDLVDGLRRDRLNRSPGATARDLLERSAFGRSVALGPNGTQRLTTLRELCFQLEQIAATEYLDYDAATARLRSWVEDPIQLDPPPVSANDAVQVMTVHQAKGLEFPVVVLWDGRAILSTRADQSPWLTARTRTGWSIALHHFTWDEPAGTDWRAVEKRFTDAERRRVVYVAATRARDLIVVPKAGSPTGSHVCGALIASSPRERFEELEIYREGLGASWSRATHLRSPTIDRVIPETTPTPWESAVTASARPRFRPGSVTHEIASAETVHRAGLTGQGGRFGTVFGDTVHRAIGLALKDESLSAAEAVRRASVSTRLTVNLREALEDVTRAITTVARHYPVSAYKRYLEYPVAQVVEDTTLMVGYVDLLAVTTDALVILDFKTDVAPAETDALPATYVRQVSSYADLIRASGVWSDHSITAGMLFTCNGSIRLVR